MLIVWDIENINFYVGLEKLKEIDFPKNSKKVFSHNTKNKPLKENNFRFLLKRDWNYFPVTNKPDAADKKLQKIIRSEMKNNNEFIIMTQDHGFHEVINLLLKNNKKVYLIVNNKADKLIRKIEKHIKDIDLLKNLTVL